MTTAELIAPRAARPPLRRRDPLARRLVRGLCRAVDWIAPPRPLSAERLIALAERRVGSDDWGPYSIREPLGVLLDALDGDAPLSPLGRRFLYRHVLETAVKRLTIVDVMRQVGNVEAQTVRHPLIVVGLPRTGTTLLYNLLCCDPRRRPLNVWEGYLPYDPRWIGRPDRRKTVTRLAVTALDALVPELRPIHHVSPTGPEECFLLLHRTFVSATYYGLAHVPSYLRWLVDCGDELLFAAYEFYRSQLKLLQWNAPERPWVLKNPSHICGLRGLLHAFPDACIVQTHRDLAKAAPSWLSLMSVARQVTLADPERIDYLADVTHYADVLRSAIDARSQAEGRFLDVHYNDLVRDPLATVARIYEHFGLRYSDEMDRRARAWLAEHPRGKHGAHRYTLDQFGLTREYLDERLSFYTDHFRIEPE